MPDPKLDDFGAGFSDFTVAGPVQYQELLDNLMITKNRKLEPRPGSQQLTFNFAGFTFSSLNATVYSVHTLPAFSALIPQIPNGAQIINKMFVWQNYLFCITGGSLYWFQIYAGYDSFGALFPPSGLNGLTWLEVTGTLDADHVVGSPKIPLHSEATFQTRYQVTDLGSRLLITSNDGMPPKIVYFPILVGPVGGSLLNPPTMIEAGLPRPEISGAPNYEQCVVSPGPDLAPEGTTASSPGFSYLYALCFRFVYTAHDGTGFIMRGPPKFLSLAAGLYWTSAIAAGAGNGTRLSGMPAYRQDARHPLPAGAALEVYRTKNAQQTYYYVEDLNPTLSDTPTTYYYDRTPDGSLGTQTLYTTGGRLGSDPAPNAKFHTVANGAVWYANSANGISATASYSTRRLTQAIPGEPSAAPEDNTLLFDTDLTGLSRADIYPVVFELGKAWRVEGLFGLDGSGSLVKRAISETIGCISADGIINLGRIILFPSETGIMMTDGFSVTPLSNHLSRTYRRWTKDAYQRDFLYGRYMERLNVCLWAFCPESSDTHSGFAASNSPNEILVLHLDQGFDGGGKFTTWSGGDFPDSFSATDLCEIGETVARADKRGWIFSHDEQLMKDPYFPATFTSPSGTKTVIWDWRTGHMDLGSDTQRKWLTRTQVTTTQDYKAFSVDWGQATIPTTTTAVMVTGSFWPAWCVGYYVSFANDGFANWVKITALSTDLTTVTVASDALTPKLLTVSGGALDWKLKIGNGGMVVDLFTARDKSGDYREMKHVHHDPAGPLHSDWRRTPSGVIRRIYTQLRLTNGDADTYNAWSRYVLESLTFHCEVLGGGVTGYQTSDT